MWPEGLEMASSTVGRSVSGSTRGTLWSGMVRRSARVRFGSSVQWEHLWVPLGLYLPFFLAWESEVLTEIEVQRKKRGKAAK